MGSRMFITDQWLLSRIFNLAYIPFFGNCFSAVSPAAQAGAFIETVYNVDRLHSALGHKPPAEFEADLARSRKPRTKSRSRIVTELAVSHTRGAVQYLGLRAQCKSVTVLEYRNTLHPAHRLLNAERVEVLDGFILHSLIFGRRGIDACKDSEIRCGKVLLAHCLIYETTLEMCGQISPIEPQEDFKIAECAFEIPSQSPQPCALDEQRSVLRPYFQCLIKLGYRLGIVAFLGCGRGEQPGAQQPRNRPSKLVLDSLLSKHRRHASCERRVNHDSHANLGAAIPTGVPMRNLRGIVALWDAWFYPLDQPIATRCFVFQER